MYLIGYSSAVLHALAPATYNAPDSWARSHPKAEISPRTLAERALALSKARAQGRNVVFVVDELGQYVARDLTRIADLQGVVESFSLVGKGKIWLVDQYKDGGGAYVYDPIAKTSQWVGGLNGPYTYSDMTGYALKNVAPQ